MDASQSAWMFLQEDMSAPRQLELGNSSLALLSIRAPGKETPNEDAAAVVQLDADGSVLMLADGMGGGAAGERAAELAVQSLIEAVRQVPGDGGPLLRTAILNGIDRANEEVCRLGMGAGTTLAVVEVQGSTVRPYHVGDSLILLVGNRGRLKLQTVSHSPVGYAIEAGLLNEADAMHHEDRHLVSNFVGSPSMRIEIGAPVTMTPRDTLLMATDGLCDNLHVEEIVNVIRKGELLAGANTLGQQARERMLQQAAGAPSKPDDLTLLAFRNRPASRSGAAPAYGVTVRRPME